MTDRAVTRYASIGDLSIAYQVVGDGPIDLVLVPGFMSHVELNWDYVFMSTCLERLCAVLPPRRLRQARFGLVGSALWERERSRTGWTTSAR